jgi:hypothetical protein
MPKGYARIACSIGKALGERRKAITSEPLPQRLTELLCRLSETEKAEQADQRGWVHRESRGGEGSFVR